MPEFRILHDEIHFVPSAIATEFPMIVRSPEARTQTPKSVFSTQYPAALSQGVNLRTHSATKRGYSRS
ncbi:MAG: hypothetical protein MUE98_06040, partial [Rhodobacteraceae bacterium]|nr:hypothetical protein [Paracoccaceae bacterium]